MNTIELYTALERRIPRALSCEWDNDGLMVGTAPDREIKSVLLTLDITEEAVIYAVKNGFDAIISHHPLIFHPLRSITAPKLSLLCKNDIAAMSFHTRLDALPGGVNDTLTGLLELQNAVPFGEDAMGRIGMLPAPLRFDDFAARVKGLLSAPRLTCVRRSEVCRKIAVLGGSGKDFIMSAAEAGADTFLTGEIGYNSLSDACEGGMNMILAGHYYTEQPVLQTLCHMIAESDGGIRTEIYDCCRVEELQDLLIKVNR